MKSTLIITTKNEIQGVTALWPTIPFEAFDEVFVIDLHSSDGTREFIKRTRICIVDQEMPGRGEAIRLACRVAGGDALVFYAPDGNEDPNDLVKLRDLILAGNDMAIASRFLPGSRNEENINWLRPRAWANRFFTWCVRAFWGGHLTDTINGFRAILKKRLIELQTDEPGFSIEFQMSIRALKLGFKIAEIPTLEGDRIGGRSTAYSVPTGLRMIRVLCKELLIGKNFLAYGR